MRQHRHAQGAGDVCEQWGFQVKMKFKRNLPFTQTDPNSAWQAGGIP